MCLLSRNVYKCEIARVTIAELHGISTHHGNRLRIDSENGCGIDKRLLRLTEPPEKMPILGQLMLYLRGVRNSYIGVMGT